MSLRRDRFAQRRKACGYTQEELAQRLGVARSTVVRWERGTTDPQPWTRPEIQQALDVSTGELDELLADDGRSVADETERLEHTLGHPSGLDLVSVANLRTQIQLLGERYDFTPSTGLIARAGECLGQIAFLRWAASDGRVLRALYAAEAEAATLMGQLVWDTSQRRDHRRAHAHYDQAINAARELRDPTAEGHALLRKSFVALYGQRDPRTGLALAQRTADTTQGDSHVLAALGLLHSAEAHAMLGDVGHCEKALGAADSELACVETTDAAGHLYSSAQFDRLAGSCYLALGQYRRARIFLEDTLPKLETRKKSRAIVLGNLALAHTREGNPDEAASALHDAIDAVTVTRGGGGSTSSSKLVVNFEYGGRYLQYRTSTIDSFP